MRHEESAILAIEDLKNWFYLNQKQGDPNPYFSIYRGTEQKPERLVFRNETESGKDEAWAMLEDILEMHTQNGGLFRIYITDRPKGNVGLHTIYRIPGNMAMSGAASNQSAGIYGLYSNPRELVEAELAKERKLWEMERRIELLQAEQDAKVGQMDVFIQEMMPVAKELARVFGLKMMGIQPGAPMQQMGNHYGDDNPDPNATETQYDYDRIDPALDRLNRVFPDTEGTLEKLANWAAANPDMAKQMLNQI